MQPDTFLPIRSKPHYRRGYTSLVMLLLAITLLTGVQVFSASTSAQAASAQLLPLTGNTPALVAHSRLTGHLASGQSLSLSIGLSPRNQSMLASVVADTTNPGSANYRHHLTQAQIIANFAPEQSTYDNVLAFLRASGFTITHTYTHHLLITFTGTAQQVEHAFHVRLNTYQTANGQTFYANTANPLLPASLASTVQVITGLNDAFHLNHAIMTPTRHQTASVRPETNKCPSTAPNSNYFLPGQIASAYNLTGLYNAGYRGEGQTVALFELDSYTSSDLTTYASCFGNTTTHISQVIVSGTPPADDGIAEVELDAEIVLSAAPKLSQLTIYNASNDGTGINAEWAQILQDNPAVVSTSWGSCEADTGSSEMQWENSLFTLTAAQGESIFAATGDSGSSGCLLDNPASPNYTLNTGDPAAQPFVTGVGGTTLTTGGSGMNTYSSETTWNETNSSLGSSTGGLSQQWNRPTWQSAPGVINSYSNGKRETPDVSLHADPNQGYIFYCTDARSSICQGAGNWQGVGGTSASTPMWAALTALMNEKSVRTGGFNLGFLNPAFYQIANGSNYNTDFHDITNGNNDYQNKQSGKYPATTAYDMATGLGSFNAANLANDVVSLAHTASGGTRISPTSTIWYFAEGSVGGGFQEYLTLQNPDASQAAHIQVTYLLQNHNPSTKTMNYTVSPGTRFTINVNNDLGTSPTGGHISVAAIVQVTSGPGIVAERPMYFNFNGIQSGTDVVGATSPGTTYYFAEGDSRQNGAANYSTFISILNPSTTTTANVTITYYTGSCSTSCPTQTLQVGPHQRGTGSPGAINVHQQVAIKVSSDQNIVVERPLYFKDNISNAGGTTTGAASQVGASAPGTDWLFAEGFTGTGFQEYFQLANFGSTTANVTVKLEYSDGTTQNLPVTVSPYGQTRVDVNQANAGHPGDASAEITSDAPIVADRLMYFHFGSSHFSGGTDVVGIPQARNTFSFAEGFTGGQFSEFLTLQNPTNADEVVAITYFTSSTVFQQQVVVKAHSRSTISVNQAINGFAQGEVSVTIQALSGTIVAERPLYFGYGSDQGGTDVFGYTGN